MNGISLMKSGYLRWPFKNRKASTEFLEEWRAFGQREPHGQWPRGMSDEPVVINGLRRRAKSGQRVPVGEYREM